MGMPFPGPPVRLSLSLSRHGVAANNCFEQPERVMILDTLFENLYQSRMVYATKELLDVTLQGKARLSAIFAHPAQNPPKNIHAFVSAVTNTTRKGSRNKRLFKNGIDHNENRMVKHAIADGCFMNMSLFRILNIKTGVGTMFVSSVFKLAVKLEDMFFKVTFERHHIPLVSLVALEGIPRLKEIFRRDNMVE